MNVQPIIDKINAETMSFKAVEDVTGLAAAKAELINTPALFVVATDDNALANAIIGRIHQQVTATISFIIVLRNLARKKGNPRTDDLAALRQELRQIILGWQPAGTEQPLEFIKGNLMSTDGGMVWWQDSYRTSYYITDL